MLADDPRHGTNAGYCAGCRNECCRRAHMVEIKQWRMGGPRKVDSLGTHRRIQALEAIGWSLAHQSRMLGRTREYVGKVLRQERVNQTTAAAIAEMYDRYSMIVPVDPPTRVKGANMSHEKARRRAAELGYAPPLAWDDIDDPNEQPNHHLSDCDDVDPVVIARILAGDWRMACTPAEKAAAIEQWTGSLNELGRLTGWNVRRYMKGTAA